MCACGTRFRSGVCLPIGLFLSVSVLDQVVFHARLCWKGSAIFTIVVNFTTRALMKFCITGTLEMLFKALVCERHGIIIR